VQHRVGRGGLAVGVRVNHDLIVIAEQRGVQRGGMQPQLAAVPFGQRPVVGQRRADLGGQGAPEVLFGELMARLEEIWPPEHESER
jgi:hypothetical protein